MLTWSQDRSLLTARLVGYPVTNKACLRCHEQGMGGYKRATPITAATDVHAAAGRLCTSCHTTNAHNISRGNWVSDSMASDTPDTDVNCSSAACHGSAPHALTANAADLNRHTKNMRCEVCHINSMASVSKNIERRSWGPSTWQPILKQWDSTPLTTSGLEYPNYWDAYTVYYPSTGANAGKSQIRWFNGVASFMAQPYGGYSTRASVGGKSQLQPFKFFLSGMLFDAGFLPGPPLDGSFDLVNNTWPYSYRWFLEQTWPLHIYLIDGFIDPIYTTPQSYWAARPDLAILLNTIPNLLQFSRPIYQSEGGKVFGTPPVGPQTAANYPGLVKAINAGMGEWSIAMGLGGGLGSDPIAVGQSKWSQSFFSMWVPPNLDSTSSFYGELGSFITQSHAVKANLGTVGTSEPCLKCHCDAVSYVNKTCATSGKYVNFRKLGYPDVDGNTIYDAMYDLPFRPPAPTFTPPPGTFNAPLNVQICSTPGTIIGYTTDGTTPTEGSGLLAGNCVSITISRTETVLKAIAISVTGETSDVASGTYILKAANPVLTPGAGSYTAPQTVTFSSATPAPTICYTTDGTTPTLTNGTQVPPGSTLVIDRSLTVKAFAFRDAMLDSGVITAAYSFKSSPPTFSPPGGTYLTPQSVVISTTTAQARIRYTIDGTTPTETVGTDLASGGTVIVDRSLVLKAVAYQVGGTPSAVVSATYTCKTTLPVLSQIGGTYGEAQNVTITSITPGASIRFTTDGITPPTNTVGTPMANGGTLLVNGTLTLKAIAYRDGWTPTSVVSATYTLKTSTPTFWPYGTTYLSPQWVTFTSATPGALFRYTTDGSTPSGNHGIIGGGLLVDRSLILKVVSLGPGWTVSNVASGTFTLRATLPVLSVVGGNYPDAQNVTITSPTPGASIHYTTDGVPLPTDTTGTLLANGGTLVVNRSLTLKAIAYRDGWTPTAGVSAIYTLKAATPTLSPPGASYYIPQTVTIDSATAGTIISYTTDGSTPSQTNGNLIPNGSTVLVDRALTLKAVAFRPGWTDTSVVSGTYTFRVTPPSLLPIGGTYSTPQTLTVTWATPGASIRYTANGTTPTCTPPNGILLPNGGLVLDRSMVLKVIACRDGWTPSSVASATYTLKAATPTLAPLGTTYYTPQNVTITSATAGTTISYTTDGSTPSQTNGLQISNGAAVPVDRSLTLKAVAFRPGWTDTTVVSGTYTFRATLPALSLIGGTYTDTRNVAISTTTVQGLIRYTTDGSTPTDTVGTDLISGSTVVVDRSLTLKAFAYRSGWTPTTVVSATYTLKAATPTLSLLGTTYNTPQTVTITSATSGTTISYTTDGSTPSQTNGNQIPNGTAVPVDRSLSLKAVAFKPGWTDTTVVSGTYTFRLTPPFLTPPGGTYSMPMALTITMTTPAASILYTTDGTTPTCDQALVLVIGSDLVVDRSMVLKVIACRAGWIPSSVVSATYTLKAATPTFSQVSGTYFTAQNVAITSATTGASISYTTDGTTPSQNTGTVIPSGGTVLMDRSMVIKAIAFKPGWTDTIVVSATFTFKVTTPVVAPIGGACLLPQSVTITSPTPGALIHYTTDGTTPTAVDGIDLANGGVVIVDRTLTLRAIAYKPSCVDSSALSATYSFKVVLPIFTPVPGTYYAPQNVTISTTTPGALIRYTTDGTIPTPDYGLTLANGGTVTISQTTYLKAIAYRDGWTATSLLSGTYTIKPPL